MIPGISLFSHLPCGFGKHCDRPYCTYYHEANSPVQSPKISEELPPTDSSLDQNISTYDETIFDNNGNSTKDANNGSETTGTSMQIIQEEEPSNSNYYSQYSYQGYVAHRNFVEDTPTYEPYALSTSEDQEYCQYGAYTPVDVDYTPRPAAKKPEKEKAKPHYVYSALDDKPKLPADLANDSILLDASHNTASSTTTNPTSTAAISRKPAIKPQIREPTASAAILKNRQDPRKQQFFNNSFQSNLNKRKSPSTTVPPTNRFNSSSNDDRSNAKLSKPPTLYQQSSPLDIPKPREFASRSPRLSAESSSALFKHSSSRESDAEDTDEIQLLDMPKMSNFPKIDTERELLEIKILERKTRLLREYKQLAQEVAEIESKKSHCTNQSFIDSLFEDDTKFEIPSSSSNEPPTKVRRLNVGDLNDIIEPYKQRIANKPAIQPSSSSIKPVATVPKPFTIPINKDTSKPNVIDKSKVLTPSTITIKRPIPTPMASSRSNLHKQMMDRIKQSTSHAAATAKRNLNNKIVAKPDLTKAGTASSTTGRVAHASTNPIPELALIDRYATKIPFSQRHRSLQKLNEEFRKHGEVDDAMAVEMAQREEKLLFDRSETPVGYASSLAGVVRTIRSKQFNIPSVSNLGQPRRQPSITETMEKERKQSGRLFTEDQFYQHLSDRYLMTPEQLKSNGYPFVYRDDEGNKRVKIEGVDEKKMFSDDNDFRRTCCRCGTEYQLRPDGTFISSQDCTFHWKRAFKKRINRTMETRYGCCDSDLTVKGCVVHPHHVCQTMRRQALMEFARTPPPNGPSDHRSRKVYAIDCEMVYTTWGISLARLTMMDWNDELVLDVLVKPKETIIDCNTKFSGLTIDMLENAECDLEKARRKLFEFVNSETILIGHSLESDLRSLRLVHRRIVDTAIVYPHRLGPPMKRALRNLASDYLQKIIQEDVEGHCSKEDASTCMQLMLKKTRGEIGSS